MVQIAGAQKSVTVKIVYYGPGMSGKTTNLAIVHQRAPEPNKGELTSISTDGDRTLFFDFMPLDLGTVAGMRSAADPTRARAGLLPLDPQARREGVDGVIFIADSSASMLRRTSSRAPTSRRTSGSTERTSTSSRWSSSTTSVTCRTR